jgi:hypothetical protein
MDQCNHAEIAQTHANLISTGNTLSVLFNNGYAESYIKLINHSLEVLPMHSDDHKARKKAQNNPQKLPTFTKEERSLFAQNRPEFLYIEYLTSRYVYYDQKCLGASREYSKGNKLEINFDLSCLRYTDHDINGLPIGPNPKFITNNSTSVPTTHPTNRVQHPLGPINIVRLVPRGLSYILTYISDVSYLLRYPHQTYPLSSDHKNHKDKNGKPKHENIPLMIAVSVSTPHTEYIHHPNVDVVIKNSNYNVGAPNLRSQLAGQQCLQDYYRTNALALYTTEISMSVKQRGVNVDSIIYANFIDPKHHDPSIISQNPDVAETTSGLVHVSEQFTLHPKLSMLWLKSENKQQRELNLPFLPNLNDKSSKDEKKKHEKKKHSKIHDRSSSHQDNQTAKPIFISDMDEEPSRGETDLQIIYSGETQVAGFPKRY